MQKKNRGKLNKSFRPVAIFQGIVAFFPRLDPVLFPYGGDEYLIY
jgi:hypothetical protein